MFPNLFTPLTIRNCTLKNRVVFGAHTNNMAEGGLPSERTAGYYLERARGGAGMIVVEPVPVHETAVLTRGNYLPDDDRVVPAFRQLVGACKAYGTVMIQQLYHVGAHGDADNSFAPNWSPSGAPSFHDADGSHAMTLTEIAEIQDAFIRCALRAKDAGFDGVELFAAYNALIDQFWTPLTNRRTDDYGGSFEKRMRFSGELLYRLRQACGENFVVGLAVSADPDTPGCLTLDELLAAVAWHDERRLIDYVTCGTGSYFDFASIIATSPYPDRLGEPFAAALKGVVRHAKVQAESRITTAEDAEALVAAGCADMVSIVRGQIADPWLVAKAQAGRPDDVRPCIACNQLCWGRRARDYWISCLVNPSAGREFMWGGDRFQRTTVPRRVLVIGGGPAGMEAARVAAERGHRVTLIERSHELGGRFRLAARQPAREKIGKLLDWYRRQLMSLQVEIRLGVEAGVESLTGYDEVVVATGALPARNGYQRALPDRRRLEGIERRNVLDIEDVLDDPAARRLQIEPDVLVLDDLGNWRGIGTAILLQERGHRVTIATPDGEVARGLANSTADGPLRRRFVQAGGRLSPYTALDAWLEDGARLLDLLSGETRTERFGTLVLATTPIANDRLARKAQEGVPVACIGDAVASRRASLAIYEGRKTGLTL
ncbi:MAG TPA: FAD-dependent oxidoreductase [Geminicoccus sp.]|jgi:2,4-dienoyl-CoA reductase-like NADH-dependent reductase (Old Yellow Enzyme family)|uniref:oxidoreductase n=1 Tax=Geminicoccus sp. TaxID=2024832 RepID=UPI002E2FBE9D|nr:FAD-dependent oxidoreductase [Geminicoccus sp.]HEX2529265.1 FAD-dependent oxidoreductase [Geminicoccus sp.]